MNELIKFFGDDPEQFHRLLNMIKQINQVTDGPIQTPGIQFAYDVLLEFLRGMAAFHDKEDILKAMIHHSCLAFLIQNKTKEQFLEECSNTFQKLEDWIKQKEVCE
jgi:hypothetical protein